MKIIRSMDLSDDFRDKMVFCSEPCWSARAMAGWQWRDSKGWPLTRCALWLSLRRREKHCLIVVMNERMDRNRGDLKRRFQRQLLSLITTLFMTWFIQHLKISKAAVLYGCIWFHILRLSVMSLNELSCDPWRELLWALINNQCLPRQAHSTSKLAD